MSQVSAALATMFEKGFVIDRKGQRRSIRDSAISEEEAAVLSKVIIDIKATVTLETGVAFGASTLAICTAKLVNNGKDRMHFGVDPNQHDFYCDAAIVSLENVGLESEFTLLNGPSHMMIPDLIENNTVLDFAFIDGWHTPDYTLIDFFLVDKMLRQGGIVAFHDMHSPSKQKVLRFILRYRRYSVQKQYRVKGNETRIRTLKFFLWRIYKNPILLFSWYHWTYQLRNSSGLIVLKKEETYEPNYDFFKNF